MNSENLLQPLNQLLEQVESILLLAQAEDWVGLESQMSDYLQSAALLEDQTYIQSLIDANLMLNAQGPILQIQGVNQKVDDLAKDSQEKVASELRHMIQSGKALDAYGR